MEIMKYWIIEKGESVGPLGADELLEKRIAETTKVWREGLDNWTVAGEVDELRAWFAPPVDSVSEAVPEIEESTQENAVDGSLADEQAVASSVSVQEPVGQTSDAMRAVDDKPLRCPYARLKAAIITTAVVVALVGVPTTIADFSNPFYYVNIPFALASIFSALRTRKLWDRGELRRARRQSDTTATWIVLNVVVALVAIPFQAVMAMYLVG